MFKLTLQSLQKSFGFPQLSRSILARTITTDEFEQRELLQFNPPSREEIFKKYPQNPGTVRYARLESLNSKEKSTELIPLHPTIWSVFPRIDIIKQNIDWQETYKFVSYKHARKPYEMPNHYDGRPWRTKGTGRARHGSIRSPMWKNGGKAHGPQNPRSYYHMIDYHKRVNGLIHTLAVKFAQDDLHIVKDLEVPTADHRYLEDFIEQRGWGISTLFVDVKDIMPVNITVITDKVPHFNVMPAYGLNCHSMLKHHTLVLTLGALNHLEDKLLFAKYRLDIIQARKKSNKGEIGSYPRFTPWQKEPVY